jgi:hypothetical protein
LRRDQVAQRLGRLAEAVLELLAQQDQVADLAGAGDPAVGVHLRLLVGDVGRRRVCVDVGIEPDGSQSSSGEAPSAAAATASSSIWGAAATLRFPNPST